MDRLTDIVLFICGTALCIGGMFTVGDMTRSLLGLGLGLALVVLSLVDKSAVFGGDGPRRRRKHSAPPPPKSGEGAEDKEEVTV